MVKPEHIEATAQKAAELHRNILGRDITKAECQELVDLLEGMLRMAKDIQGDIDGPMAQAMENARREISSLMARVDAVKRKRTPA